MSEYPGRARGRRPQASRTRVRLLRHVTPAAPRTRPAAGAPPAARQPVAALSDRETEIVQAIARGRTNNEIAAGLFISLSTVKSHLTSVHHKLGTRNRVEIAAWAWETGLAQAAR